jgi:TetR/AcrR family transcriptional repressor of bet genes
VSDPQSTEPQGARAFNKARNRKALLDAAALAIYKYGFKATTIDRIQEISGLSRGMINQYFGSKDALLWAVAEQLMNEYLENWKAEIRDPALTPAQKIERMFRADLSEKVLNRQCVAIWFSFRSEVSGTVNFRTLVDKGDLQTEEEFRALCTELCEAGGYDDVDPVLAAKTFTVILEGFWTDFHLHADRFDKKLAMDVCLNAARSFFPRHFQVQGANKS